MEPKKHGNIIESNIILDGIRPFYNLQATKNQWWADIYVLNTMRWSGGELGLILKKRRLIQDVGSFQQYYQLVWRLFKHWNLVATLI